MLSIDTRIDRTQRLLRMLEQDAPLLAIRVAPLSPEQQQSAKSHAAELTAQARAELERLRQERSKELTGSAAPQAAD
jgi:phosphoribosylaminoimidazole carboxylase (NCAIR synthetase)